MISFNEFDNFEQITPAAPAISDLLSACPRLHVVVTSRSALNVRGEHRFPVPPLPVPDMARLPGLLALRNYPAVALFVERAEAVNSAFSLTENNVPAVVAICARLDGLPLAIELAAARVDAFLPHEILNRLSSRMAFLTGGARDVSARQRTLQGAVSWSYELLNEQEKRLFERLSVFVGGATLNSAEAVCSADGSAGDVVEGVTSLLNASLLGRSEGRFVMLETLREFARERLDARGESETRRDHAQYFLTLAERAVLDGAWLDRLEGEHDNLRAALGWTVERGETDMGLMFTEPLWRFWHMCGYLNEGRAWLAALLALRGEEATEGRARALNGAGVLACTQGDYEAARVHLRESLRIRRALGNRPRVAGVLNNLGAVAYMQEAYAEAQRLYEESLALYRVVDPTRIPGTLGNLGLVVFLQGDDAREIEEEVLAHFRAADDDWNIVTSLNNLARVVRRQGDDAYAASLLGEGLTLGRNVGAAGILVDLVEKVAGLVAARGEYDTAARLWGAAEAYRKRIGAPMEPVSHLGYERDLMAAKARSRERAFTAVWLEGRALDFDDAVTSALAAVAPYASALPSAGASAEGTELHKPSP